ncbi:helix-turn-helix domain-containing protein [uncultured Pseudomonas sp.]
MLQTQRAQGQSLRCIGRALGRSAGSLSRDSSRYWAIWMMSCCCLH